MTFLPNDWNAIRAHYAAAWESITRAGRNEWGIDPYLWDSGYIHLTPIEDRLWEHIRAVDAVLYPQYPIGRHFVDFANPVAKVVVECDGAAYHRDTAKDAARDAQLTAQGWTVYRISGSDCHKDNDLETGVPGAARLFMERICEAQGISRNSRTAEEDAADDGWMGPGIEGFDRFWSTVIQCVQTHDLILSAARRAASL